MDTRLFATVPKGMEDVLADELRGFGALEVAPTTAGVAFAGTLETAYRACLWSRTASRVLLPIAHFPAPSPEALYDGVRGVRWHDHLRADGTLAVDFTSTGSFITHTQYGALKTKDAIVDQFRDATGVRPSVDVERPDVRVNVHVRADAAILSIDLSGGSLHRRGYREEGGPAPLKESLAAAVLLLAGWPAVAAAGGAFLDPMCGSGTLPIEAGLIAADVAPGLARDWFGFLRWRGHDVATWTRLVTEAKARDRRGRERLPRVVGYDADPRAVRTALGNLERAGLRGLAHIEKRELADAAPMADEAGVLVVNPPYGERIGEKRELELLYRRLGDLLKQRFAGWTGYVLTGNPDLAKFIGLKATRRQVLFNGAIECRLLTVPVHAARPRAEGAPAPEAPATAFANRLRKNAAHLAKWAKREGISCYRLYDADLPEYAVEVDLYERWVHLQEYERPDSVDQVVAVKRLNDAVSAIVDVLGVARSDVFLQQRLRRRGHEQYEKTGESGDFREVREGGHRFLVNFRDYFDTGLFLDHRLTRRMVGELARGRHVLNLFAYTGAASVYAARGGALSTTTIDLSNTYLEWAARNFERNGIGGRAHRLVRADCIAWLREARDRFGLIFLDPPTFSNSKAMAGTLDIQRDHADLIRSAARLLTSDGVLIFSNNFKRFKMDREALEGFVVEDVTRATIPPDFARNPRIHNTWLIRRA